MNKSYPFGIEEEFFLADAVTRGTARRTVDAFHKAVHTQMPEVERELLQSQVEIASPPCTKFSDAREALLGLRTRLADIGREHGVLVFAAGTHPTAKWSRQSHTEKERYQALAQEMKMLARRDVVCGMHVHVEVPRPEDRVDLMNRLLPYTPLLLALSASSPFWQGEETGLAAYRLSVWGEMPRTGLPDLFKDAAEYEHYVATMVKCGAIKDASFLWWTLRPSIHYPTLELRVADSCTSIEDTLAIAALYRCLVRHVVSKPKLNHGLTGASRALISENMWRAQRNGIRAEFIDEAIGAVAPCATFLELTLTAIADDVEALDCGPEIERARKIVADGTSADHQLAIFKKQAEEANGSDALAAVVDWLAQTTAGTANCPNSRRPMPSIMSVSQGRTKPDNSAASKTRPI